MHAATMAAMSFRPFGSLRGYRTEWLSGDAIAGLTVWAVLVPEALAYATIAGVSPVVGLYAAPGALILYAVFGSSRHLITGPMSATAALSAAVVAQLATAGSNEFVTLTAALAITAGVIALLAGLLRLGFLANFISEPVLKGFIIGLALTIIVGQLPKLFGVEKGERRLLRADLGPHPAPRRHGVADAARRRDLARDRARLPALRAGGPGLARRGRVRDRGGLRVRPRPARRRDRRQHRRRAAVVRAARRALRQDYLELAGRSVGVMLVGFAEGLGAAKTYAAQQHYEIDANRELLGLGAANLGAGPLERHGRQRQPLEDRGQRRRGARRSSPAWSSPRSRSSRCCSSPACSSSCPRRRWPPS